MNYQWREIKRAQNKIKHGLDFAVVQAFDWTTVFCLIRGVIMLNRGGWRSAQSAAVCMR